MNTIIGNKLNEIADCIFKAMKCKELEVDDLGLLSGQTGIIIFCSHYLKLHPDSKKTKILQDYMNVYFERLTSGVTTFSYCSGLAGILEGLRYMNESNLFKLDYSDIENNYINLLQGFALHNIAAKNYDYLHGALGVIKYFHDDAVFVNKALLLLEEMAEKDGDRYKWKSPIGMERKIGYNISLSHGISSIVAVLSHLNSHSIDLKIRNRIITNACNYILSQQIDPQKFGCYFPSLSLDNIFSEDIYRSRMGWCYGDLGVSTSLWQAGRLLKNKDWQDKACQVMSYSAYRRDYRNCGIFDSGLCHGTASVCMMFHYIYSQTGFNLYKETRDYWLTSTLEMGRRKDGLAGYKAWNGEKQGYVSEYGLLEGIAGIGLMFLAILSSDNNSKWMDFFMLN